MPTFRDAILNGANFNNFDYTALKLSYENAPTKWYCQTIVHGNLQNGKFLIAGDCRA